MNASDQELRKRLLYILHLGCVEIRNLALDAGNEQIADLADALELLPRFVDKCEPEDLELVRFVLKTYQDKHHSPYDFPARLDRYDAPERY
jgi:hypothetical protein